MARYLTVLILAIATVPATGLPRIEPHLGHPWWPVYVDDFRSPIGRPTLAVTGGSYNSFTYDVGILDPNTLFIRDAEVAVAALETAIPGRTFGDRVPGDARLDVAIHLRSQWPGFLDGVIDLHHAVTGLPDADRGARDRYEVFTMIVEDTPIDEDAVASYRDQALLLQTRSVVMPAASIRGQLPVGAPLPRVGNGTPVVGVGIGGGVLSAIRPSRGAPAYLTAGAGLGLDRVRLLRWLSVSIQAGVWRPFYPVGRRGWEPVLARHVNWRAGLELSAVVGLVQLQLNTTAERTPFRYDHPRIGGVATSIDATAGVPVGDRSTLVVAFVQDLVTFITPDFGVSVGWQRSVGAPR